MLLQSFSRAVQLLLYGNPEVYFIAFTSLQLSSISILISSLISLPLGVLLGFKDFPGRRAIIIILNTMMSLPTVVVGLLVYSLISRSGPLGNMGLLFSRGAIIIGQTLLSLPIIISLVYGAISRIDRRLPETLTTLGAQPGDIFIMTLKEGKIAILSALLAGFGRVIGEVGVSMMLGGNIRWYTRTLTTAIALETSKGEFDLALALGLILLVISFAVNLSLHWLVKDER